MNNILKFIEQRGNQLPEPTTIFFGLSGIIMCVSVIGHWFQWTVSHPGKDQTVEVVNLFSSENIQKLFVDLPDVFAEFPPLSLVIVVMLGIGVADRVGLFNALLWSLVKSLPNVLLSGTVVLMGILSSVTLDAGYVVLIPLGALAFYGANRHPLAGLAAAFAGVSAGFSANLTLTALDPLLAGFSTPAAQIVTSDYVVNATDNYYLMVGLVPVLTIVGSAVTELFIEPYLGTYEKTANVDKKEFEIDREAMVGALGSFLVIVIGIIILSYPSNAVLRNEQGQLNPLINSTVSIMFIGFLVPGIVYGILTGEIRSDEDIVEMMNQTVEDLASYIVMAFAAAIALALFKWSNLGMVFAIEGANGLRTINLQGIPLLIGLFFLTAFINLVMGSASAKWALLAPVFIPMMMVMGYSPELTQAVYRIGDSSTNIITPFMPYFPLIITFARRYDEETNIGTIITLMLPYSIAFSISGMGLLLLWYLFGLPLGPGANLVL